MQEFPKAVPGLVAVHFPLSDARRAPPARSSQQPDCSSSDLQSHRPNFSHLQPLILAMRGRSCQIIVKLLGHVIGLH